MATKDDQSKSAYVQEAELPTAKHAWPVLFSIFLLSMLIAGTWMCIPSIKADFGATYGMSSMASFGNLMQFVSYGAFVGAIIAAPLAQKLSVKTALIAAGAFAIIGAAVSAISGTDLTVLFVGRALLGVGVGLSAVTSVTAIGIWFPVKTRGMAMSIWAVWVPVGMLIFMNAATPIINVLGGSADGASGFNNLFWLMAVLLVVALVLILIIYRSPREGEASATIRTQVPLKQALPHLAKPALIAVAITWLVFNAVNQVNTTYIVPFMQAGYGFDQPTAAFLGSIASAAGIAAIIFGFISDRLQVDKKYLLIVISSAALTLAMVLGYKPADLSQPIGMAQFVGYLVFMFIGNAGLVACVRPYVPLLVGKGGVIAIGYALAGVTLIQYIGQMFNTPFGQIVDGIVGSDVSSMMSQGRPLGEFATQTGAAFGEASWILVGFGVVGFIASFFLRVKKPKQDQTHKQDDN